MPYCVFCGNEIGYLPFRCKYCNGTYCKKHRLPENHECTFEMKVVPVVPDTRREVRPMYPDVEFQKPRYRESEYKRQKDLNKYLKNQQKQKRRSQKGFERSMTGGTTQATSILIILIFIFSIIVVFIPPLIAFSLYGITSLFLWVIITSLFTSYGSVGYPYSFDLFGLLFLFVLIFFFYNIARNIEIRFGSHFVIKLYLFCTGISAGCYVILRLLLAIVYPISLNNIVLVGFATGGILGLISFIVYFNPDQEMMLFCFFIPVRMKGRVLVIILILFRLIFGLMYGIIFSPLYLALYIPDLGGILASYLVFYFKYKYK